MSNVIAAFNSKGGSAKSTAILVLADTFARQGASVSVIDTDPQRTIANWREQAKTSTIHLVEETNSISIHRTIKEETARSAWVFVDMAGFTSDMRTPVVSRSNLIIVPMQASPEDARMAARAFGLISADEDTLNRHVNKKILWARTIPNMIQRVERRILDEINANSVPSFANHLHERSAYKAMMLEGKPLGSIDQDQFNGVPKAIENADRLAAEIIEHFITMKETSV